MTDVDISEDGRPSWRDRAACHGMDAGLWFPDRGTGREAKAICAACPVRVECLEGALDAREKDGILGGASTRRRRVLLVAYLQRSHSFDVRCTNRSCRWCPIVREHFDQLEGNTAGPVVLNGPGARCGYRSTYARGCRSGSCTFAASAVGVRFVYAGWDIPDWWAETFGDNDSADLIDIAKFLAAALLGIGQAA